MKKFHLQIAFFLGIFLILFHLIPIYRYYTKQYFHNAGSEIFAAVDKSEVTQNQKIQKLYLGDSVDEQIVSSKNLATNELNLSTNQAISLVGQYILLKNLIENKNKIDTVELRILPMSLSNNLDNQLTYNYFLKPFYKKRNYKNLSGTVISQIEKIPFYFLSQYLPVLTSLWSPNTPQPTINHVFSPINKEYLAKIFLLCKGHHIYLNFRSSPICESNRQSFLLFKREALKTNSINFKEYFNSIKFYPTNYFLADQIHFKKEFLTKDLY